MNGQVLIKSEPVAELKKLATPLLTLNNIRVTDYAVSGTGNNDQPYMVTITGDSLQEFSLILSNSAGEQLVIGYDGSDNQYYIDRKQAGKSDFNKSFAGRHVAPRFATNKKLQLTLVVDRASAELFADDGLTVMTSIFFPHSMLNLANLKSASGMEVKRLQLSRLRSVW